MGSNWGERETSHSEPSGECVDRTAEERIGPSGPDWVALWGGDDSPMTPWQAFWLARCADSILEVVPQFMDISDDSPLFEDIASWCRLPSVVEPFFSGLDVASRIRWVTAYLNELTRISAMLRVGSVPWPETIGAEVALRAVVSDAELIAGDEGFVDDDGPPTEVSADERVLGAVEDMLFEDDDVLWLFHPDIAEVVIDPAGDLAIQMFAPNLHPARWFINSADGIESLRVDLDDDSSAVAVAQELLDRRLGVGRAKATKVATRHPESVIVATEMLGLRANVALQVDFERNDEEEAVDAGSAVMRSASIRAIASAGPNSMSVVVVDLWSLFGFAHLPEFEPAAGTEADNDHQVQPRRSRRTG